jgi:hypothetical protein
MDNTGQRTAQRLQSNRAYLVMKYLRSSQHHTDLNMGLLREHGVYMDSKDAVQQLKAVRLKASNGSIPPASPKQRDKYQLRNKIGELQEGGDLIGWGYSWVDPDDEEGETVAHWMWIEKTMVYRRKGERGEEDKLSARQLEVLEAEGGIDYVAVGQHAPVLPANAVFDEATQDFVFDDEGDGSRGGDQV